MRRTFEAYQKLRDTNPSKWPELALAAIRVSGPEKLEAEDAGRRLEGARNGWVRHRSGRRRLDEPAKVEFGPPQFAEWVEAEGKVSHRLGPHPDEPGSLALWRYAEEPGADAFEALAQDVAVLDTKFDVPTAANSAPLLLYRVYWGAPEDDPSALRRLFARFLGFEARERFAGRKIVIRNPREE